MKYKWTNLYPNKITKKQSPKEIVEILLSNRQIEPANENQFLNPLNPKKLTASQVGINKEEIKQAVKLIKQTGKKKKIIIYGDYDVDGIAAAGLLWESLWQRDYDVLPFIPNRDLGYGLKKEAIERLMNEHPDLDLIITVDNGIVAHQAVEYAKSKGIKVIITDHHQLSETLLPADAIIHSTKVAGSGVSWFLAKEFGYRQTDLVALGTISDLMPLTSYNRSFVKFGLEELSRSRRVGIRELKRVAGLNLGQPLSPWQISFILAPRLNAAGRIDDPLISLRILCSKNKIRAKELAEELDKINFLRQEMMKESFDLAKEVVHDRGLGLEKLIVIADKNFHPGIIGLIAGNLTEEYNRPAVVISKGPKVSKGSARSIPGISIVDLIRQTADVLINIGGHESAAGFSVQTSKLSKLNQRLVEIGQESISDENLILKKRFDFEIDFSLINKRLYRLGQKLAPFGCGNPKPTFLLRNARIMNLQTVGSDGSHLKLWLDDPTTPKIERIAAEAIGFGWGDWQEELLPGDTVNLIFNFNLNRWNGKETLQLKIKDMELC